MPVQLDLRLRGDGILRFSVEVKDEPFMREKDTKGSDMRFATERAFRRCCVKAELTFASFSLMKGTISPSKLKPDWYKYPLTYRIF